MYDMLHINHHWTELGSLRNVNYTVDLSAWVRCEMSSCVLWHHFEYRWRNRGLYIMLIIFFTASLI